MIQNSQVFQNAVSTLQECVKHLEDDEMCKKEIEARKLLVILCSHVADDMDWILDE